MPTSYFPKAEALRDCSEEGSQSESPTPAIVLDPGRADQPILEYDSATYDLLYAPKVSSAPAPIPPQPHDFSDRYISPMLTPNERLRLTMLWYYTRGMTNDMEMVAWLREIVNLVQDVIGWDFTIMGILDSDSYTRIATCNFPRAVLPRKETTCAHTVNQEPGSVFLLPNMTEDWRFKESPPAKYGLQSYAGAQLRCKTEDGHHVALGTLCVACSSPKDLSEEKQRALVRFADVITAEIVNRSRMTRQRERQKMNDQLAQIQTRSDCENMEELVLDSLRRVYPDAQVGVKLSDSDTVRLDGCRPISFSYSSLQEGLWEDSDFIDSALLARNNTRMEADRPIRGVIGNCGRCPLHQFLVVTSNDMRFVFDDVDAWFVARCASILASFLQERSLREALKAKKAFLRGITHQLRTPIHGVLGSCELLMEELTSRNLLGSMKQQSLNGIAPIKDDAQCYLATIRNSGHELMWTVNNMLTLNHWADITHASSPATLQDLRQLESDVINDINQMVQEEDLRYVTFFFDNQLAPNTSTVTIDITLVKECLRLLVLNAVQSTKRGTVVVVVNTDPEYSALQFDVIDTGCGIQTSDQRRIFDAYEKVDPFSRGVGLGLTVASKIAAAMDGSIALMDSEPGRGTHIRLRIGGPSFACAGDRGRISNSEFSWMPMKFFQAASSGCSRITSHFIRHLEYRGFTASGESSGSLNLCEFAKDRNQFYINLAHLDPRSVTICLVPAGESERPLRNLSTDRKVLFFEGPFLSSRLDEILKQADLEHKDASASLSPTEIVCDPTDQACKRVLRRARKFSVKPHALIVDDNAINLRIMRMYCQKRKIAFVSAVDGRQAVERFTAASPSNPINLVLMDLQMPHCDGIQACAEMRSFEESKALPRAVIFIITGQDSAEDKALSFGAGANEFYTKPLSLEALDRGIGVYFQSFKQH